MKYIFFNLVFILLLAVPCKILATSQIPDNIILIGKEESLLSNPLEVYFKSNPDKRPNRKDMLMSSALWRGYIATFEVLNNELFVKDIVILTSQDEDNEDEKWISVYNEVFNKIEPTKVDWLNGLLVIPHGEIINYVHMGYGSTYENYTILEILNGNLTKERYLNYREYEVFKENQFQAYKKTKEYEEKVKMFQNEGERDIKFLNSFLKNFVIDYTSKILDDSEIVIEEVKKEIDKRLVGEWYGEEKDKQQKGLSKKWTMSRYSDGTYKIEFEFTQNGRTNKNTEYGEWWTEGNIFYEFHELSGMTDEYEFEVLNKKQVKFKMIKTDADFKDEAYTFIDTKVTKKK